MIGQWRFKVFLLIIGVVVAFLLFVSWFFGAAGSQSKASFFLLIHSVCDKSRNGLQYSQNYFIKEIFFNPVLNFYIRKTLGVQISVVVASISERILKYQMF